MLLKYRLSIIHSLSFDLLKQCWKPCTRRNRTSSAGRDNFAVRTRDPGMHIDGIRWRLKGSSKTKKIKYFVPTRVLTHVHAYIRRYMYVKTSFAYCTTYLHIPGTHSLPRVSSVLSTRRRCCGVWTNKTPLLIRATNTCRFENCKVFFFYSWRRHRLSDSSCQISPRVNAAGGNLYNFPQAFMSSVYVVRTRE